MSIIHISNILKNKKIILPVVIPIVTVVFVIAFVSLSAQKSRNEEVVIFKQGEQSDTSNKSEAGTSQLQKVLEKTIDTVDGVSSSSVTINIGKNSSQPSAFIIINLSSGKKLTLEQQASIKKTVKNSVKNLSEDNIHLSMT